MKLGKNAVSVIAAVAASAVLTASGQTQTKKDNNDTLDVGSSWVSGNAPTASDVAIWDATVATAANCSNTVAVSLGWGGIRILDPVAPVKVTSTSTLTLGGSGIDLNQSATSQDLWVAMSVATGGDQNWAVKSGRLLTLGDASRNVNIQHNVTALGHLSYVNNLQVQSGGTLNIADGTLIDPGGAVVSGATINIGANGTAGNSLNQSGGMLQVRRSSGSAGSPAASLSIASASSSSAVYNMTGGSLIDISPADTAWLVIGAGGNANGTLNVDGTASLQLIKVLLGNSTGATGTLNITNGTLTVASTVFDVGRSSGGAHGFVNVYGGTLSVAATMNLGRGIGDGTLNVYGGNTYLNGLNVSAYSSTTGPGTNTITGGLEIVTNNLTLASSGSAHNAEVNLNGGTLIVGSVARGSGTGPNLAFNLNGGTLKPRSSGGTFIAATVPAYVKAGGAVIDTAGFNALCAASLQDGTGGGGLTKLGAGRLTLLGSNTYTGSTLVSAGELCLNTTGHPGGPISVNGGALLRTTLAAAGTTLPCSSLTVGTTTGAALDFDIGTNANPTLPLVYATNLSAFGTASVSVYGSGIAQGVIPLIQYDGNLGGGGTFTLSFVEGWSGYVTNNTSAKQVQLVITSAKALVWRAAANNNWDTTSVNWYDLSNLVAAVFTGGADTYFDDSTSNALVNLTARMAPGSVTINNSSSNYAFSGVGQITGVGELTKLGPGMVTMAVSNYYSGSTLISNGVFILGANGAIPPNAVSLEGTLEMAGFSDSFGSLNGASGVVLNSSNAPVVLGVTGGTFGGSISNPGGSLTLNKSGGGTLTLLSKNAYSGGTTNAGGSLVLGYEQSLGTGPLALGATLAWLDAAPHTLTNPVAVIGGTTFGNGLNGPLTITNVVDFAGGSYNVTCNTNSDVLFPNGMANGGLSGKNGPATLTLRKTVGEWLNSTFLLSRGTLVLDDHSAVILENGNTRIRCNTDDETARFVINSGSSYTMSNTPSQNFRFGDGTSAGANSSNVLDLSGALTITPYTGSGSKLQMGSASDPAQQNILNLLPGGLLRVKQIRDESPSSTSTFNFNGGTLSPNSDELATTFMQNLDGCFILDGGAFIDTAGWSVAIRQDIQSGGSGTGGLTKLGLGRLDLNGYNTYAGPTVVQAGGLGGIGSISGPVTVQSGAALMPGPSIGTLIIYNTLTLAGGSSTVMEISKASGSLTSDQVSGVSTLRYGGTLVVNNIGPDALAVGDTFTLFMAGTYTGSFAGFVLPSSVSWDTSKLNVDGSIKVLALNPASFGSIALMSGTNLVMSGTGGPANGTYYVFASTNVALPLASWTPIFTNAFGSDGSFSFTNVVNPSGPAASFFRINY